MSRQPLCLRPPPARLAGSSEEGQVLLRGSQGPPGAPTPHFLLFPGTATPLLSRHVNPHVHYTERRRKAARSFRVKHGNLWPIFF